MESHARATSSVYSSSFTLEDSSAFEDSFALDDLLEQITAQAREHQTSGDNDVPPESCGIDGARTPRAAVRNNALPGSCEMYQTLERQLVMQNAELQQRLDKARKHFARLYNAMEKAMEVSRELYKIYLTVVHENEVERKRERASGEYF
ncbi:hypothetical protein V2A60_002421 [Cordyceps javanica]